MKKVISAVAGFAVVVSMGLVATSAMAAGMGGKAVGTWKTPTGSVVRITGGGRSIAGTIVSVRNKSRRDSKNPKTSLRKRKLPGIRIFSLRKNGANAWKGSLYNTEDGKTYAGHIKVLSANKIKLSGCVASIFCKNQTWIRK
ncbi:MAG: DUF2147 domain-containing protein [bacterium]|nr:DUF2147 domain-containing protein [bacterium]